MNLVTGGAGFIGSNFARWVRAHRPEVRLVIFDKLTYAGRLENLGTLIDGDRCIFVKGDIASEAEVRRCFEASRPTAVLNFAAESHVDRSIDGPRDFVDTNLVGTFELLEAARVLFAELDEAAREEFRFLHVSTDEVYGSIDEGAWTEEWPLAPRNPYSATKASAELLVRSDFCRKTPNLSSIL